MNLDFGDSNETNDPEVGLDKGYRARSMTKRNMRFVEARTQPWGKLIEYDMYTEEAGSAASTGGNGKYIEMSISDHKAINRNLEVEEFRYLTENSKFIIMGHGAPGSENIQTDALHGARSTGRKKIELVRIAGFMAANIGKFSPEKFNSLQGPVLKVTLFSCSAAAPSTLESAERVETVANSLRTTMAGKLLNDLLYSGVVAQIRARTAPVIKPSMSSVATSRTQVAHRVILDQLPDTFEIGKLYTLDLANLPRQIFRTNESEHQSPGARWLFRWKKSTDESSSPTMEVMDLNVGTEVDPLFERQKDRTLQYLYGRANESIIHHSGVPEKARIEAEVLMELAIQVEMVSNRESIVSILQNALTVQDGCFSTWTATPRTGSQLLALNRRSIRTRATMRYLIDGLNQNRELPEPKWNKVGFVELPYEGARIRIMEMLYQHSLELERCGDMSHTVFYAMAEEIEAAPDSQTMIDILTGRLTNPTVAWGVPSSPAVLDAPNVSMTATNDSLSPAAVVHVKTRLYLNYFISQLRAKTPPQSWWSLSTVPNEQVLKTEIALFLYSRAKEVKVTQDDSAIKLIRVANQLESQTNVDGLRKVVLDALSDQSAPWRMPDPMDANPRSLGCGIYHLRTREMLRFIATSLDPSYPFLKWDEFSGEATTFGALFSKKKSLLEYLYGRAYEVVQQPGGSAAALIGLASRLEASTTETEIDSVLRSALEDRKLPWNLQSARTIEVATPSTGSVPQVSREFFRTREILVTLRSRLGTRDLGHWSRSDSGRGPAMPVEDQKERVLQYLYARAFYVPTDSNTSRASRTELIRLATVIEGQYSLPEMQATLKNALDTKANPINQSLSMFSFKKPVSRLVVEFLAQHLQSNTAIPAPNYSDPQLGVPVS